MLTSQQQTDDASDMADSDTRSSGASPAPSAMLSPQTSQLLQSAIGSNNDGMMQPAPGNDEQCNNATSSHQVPVPVQVVTHDGTLQSGSTSASQLTGMVPYTAPNVLNSMQMQYEYSLDHLKLPSCQYATAAAAASAVTQQEVVPETTAKSRESETDDDEEEDDGTESDDTSSADDDVDSNASESSDVELKDDQQRVDSPFTRIRPSLLKSFRASKNYKEKKRQKTRKLELMSPLSPFDEQQKRTNKNVVCKQDIKLQTSGLESETGDSTTDDESEPRTPLTPAAHGVAVTATAVTPTAVTPRSAGAMTPAGAPADDQASSETHELTISIDGRAETPAEENAESLVETRDVSASPVAKNTGSNAPADSKPSMLNTTPVQRLESAVNGHSNTDIVEETATSSVYIPSSNIDTCDQSYDPGTRTSYAWSSLDYLTAPPVERPAGTESNSASREHVTPLPAQDVSDSIPTVVSNEEYDAVSTSESDDDVTTGELADAGAAQYARFDDPNVEHVAPIVTARTAACEERSSEACVETRQRLSDTESSLNDRSDDTRDKEAALEEDNDNNEHVLHAVENSGQVVEATDTERDAHTFVSDVTAEHHVSTTSQSDTIQLVKSSSNSITVIQTSKAAPMSIKPATTSARSTVTRFKPVANTICTFAAMPNVLKVNSKQSQQVCLPIKSCGNGRYLLITPVVIEPTDVVVATSSAQEAQKRSNSGDVQLRSPRVSSAAKRNMTYGHQGLGQTPKAQSAIKSPNQALVSTPNVITSQVLSTPFDSILSPLSHRLVQALVTDLVKLARLITV